jgi:hypothetical protein
MAPYSMSSSNPRGNLRLVTSAAHRPPPHHPLEAASRRPLLAPSPLCRPASPRQQPGDDAVPSLMFPACYHTSPKHAPLLTKCLKWTAPKSAPTLPTPFPGGGGGSLGLKLNLPCEAKGSKAPAPAGPRAATPGVHRTHCRDQQRS